MGKTIRVVLFAVSLSSQANGSVLFDLNGSAGWTRSTLPSGGVAPTVVQIGLGGELGWIAWGSLRISAKSDFRAINQYTEPDNSVGNLTGYRWNIIAPSLGWDFSWGYLSLDAQFLGDYRLWQSNLEGMTVSYQNPLGGRVTVAIDLVGRFSLGAFFEYLSFGAQKVGEATSTLSTRYVLWQAGAHLGFTVF